MLKIGITTFSRTHNYGSLLQSFALQQILLKKYHLDNEFINYSNQAQREMYALYSKPNSLKNVVKNLIVWKNKILIKQHFEDFEAFFKENLMSSNVDLHDGDIIPVDKYSLLVTGSDQVWNTDAYDFDEIYFLPFADELPKVAYACSLGGTNLLNKTDKINLYKKYLEDFQAISVRERNSQTWISQLTKDEVDIVADPTLLLDKKDYLDSFDDQPLIEGKYIYYYGFKYEHDMNMKVKELGEKLGLPVYCLDAKKYHFKMLRKYGFKISPHGGPKAFINLINHCEVSVTTSFHGTVFSAIFQKPFFYLRKPGIDAADDRASYLLEQLDLTSQDVPYSEIVARSEELFSIDYNHVQDKILKLQQHSFRYIDKNIVRLSKIRKFK